MVPAADKTNYFLRYAVNSRITKPEDVNQAWRMIQTKTEEILIEHKTRAKSDKKNWDHKMSEQSLLSTHG